MYVMLVCGGGKDSELKVLFGGLCADSDLRHQDLKASKSIMLGVGVLLAQSVGGSKELDKPQYYIVVGTSG